MTRIHTGIRESVSVSPAPEGFALAKEDGDGDAQVAALTENAQGGAAEQSAADYDPSMDRREDEQKRVRGEDAVVAIDVEEVEVEEEEEEDVEDMFALAMGEKKPKTVKKKVMVSILTEPVRMSTFLIVVYTFLETCCTGSHYDKS